MHVCVEQQANRAPTYDQKPMLDAQPNQQQQAYLQHVELIQQHKAVEAHQRLMAQRNDMASSTLCLLIVQLEQWPRPLLTCGRDGRRVTRSSTTLAK